MKREIKFRFWTPESIMIQDHTGWREDIGINEAILCSQSYGYKVMQYSGLKDKNDNEIYEGDIVKIRSDDKLMVISWSERFASFTIISDGWAFQHWFGEAMEASDCEIIGNIYENPSLIRAVGV